LPRSSFSAYSALFRSYAVAGQYNALVVGSDQAAESLTGFFTKFGDGAADIMPLSGLTKTQVRDMGTRLGADSKLVDKVPTADLRSEEHTSELQSRFDL